MKTNSKSSFIAIAVFIFATFSFSLILISCSEEQMDNNLLEVKSKTESSLINVPHDEIFDLDSEFQEEIGVHNLILDHKRQAFINIGENRVYIPIQPDYEIVGMSSSFPKVTEVGAGIKFKLARLKPSKDPTKCQGDCKCGIGFRCGSVKHVYIDFETYSIGNFNIEDREVIAKQLIDTDGNYYILEILTTNINWIDLEDE
ncbi:MAG TPA: hypothetical protein VK050_01910 [Flavobacteriaceae bacterium]|nr:hypothetical protein [Flavobacteriaceae bacterium]